MDASTRSSNRIRKATDRLDPSNISAKKSSNGVHQVSDNSSCENARPHKKARTSNELKEPKPNEYLPLQENEYKQEKEYDLVVPLNPIAGLCPDKDKQGFYFAEDVIARKQKANGSWEFRIRWMGYDQQHDSWVPFRNLNDYLKQCVYEKYTLKKRAPIEITPEQQEKVDRAIAETKKLTEERNEELRRKGLPFDYNVDPDQFDTISTVDETTGYIDKDYIPEEVEEESEYGDFNDIEPDTDIEEYTQTISEEKTFDYATDPCPITPDTTCAPRESGKMLHRPPSTIYRGKCVRSENSAHIPPIASLHRGKTLDGDGRVKKSSRRVSKQSPRSSSYRAKKSKASVAIPRGSSKKKPSPMIDEIRKKIALIGKKSKLKPDNFSEERGEGIVQILEMLEILLEKNGFCEKISTTNACPEMDVEPVDVAFHDASYATPGNPVCNEAQKRITIQDQSDVSEYEIHIPSDPSDFNFDEGSNPVYYEAQKRSGIPKDPVQDQRDVNEYEIHVPSDPPGFNLDEETNNVACVTQTQPSEEETQPPEEFLKNQSVLDQSVEQTKIQDKCQNEPIYDSDSLDDDDDEGQVHMGGWETQEDESTHCDQNFVSQSDSLSAYHSACDDDSESGF